MRIIWILTAAAGAAALGVAAEARSPANHRGPVFKAPGGGSPGWRARPDFRRGVTSGWSVRRDRRHGGPDRRFRDRDGFLFPFGLADSDDWPDPHGNGFFAGAGGEIRIRGGRPYYDYDRSYPYEWASSAAGSAGWNDDEERVRDDRRRSYPVCSVEQGVRVCRGGR